VARSAAGAGRAVDRGKRLSPDVCKHTAPAITAHQLTNPTTHSVSHATHPHPHTPQPQGPEIRTGMLEDGKPVQLTAGQVRGVEGWVGGG